MHNTMSIKLLQIDSVLLSVFDRACRARFLALAVWQ